MTWKYFPFRLIGKIITILGLVLMIKYWDTEFPLFLAWMLIVFGEGLIEIKEIWYNGMANTVYKT